METAIFLFYAKTFANTVFGVQCVKERVNSYKNKKESKRLIQLC